MNSTIEDQIIKTYQSEWIPLIEDGVNTEGIFIKALRKDNKAKRAPTFLLKFDAGASYPYHNHPAGEEVFVIEGKITFNGTELTAGDYLYTPPNFKHSVKSETGCVILFIVPEEVEIL